MSERHGNLQKYQSSNPLQRFLIDRFLHKVGSLVAALPVKEVLDVGCAESFVSRYLAAVAGLRLSFAGVDIDAAALKRGQAEFPQMLRSFGNITALPFATEQFDLVLCTEVLEHLPEPLLGLRELRRVTRRYCLLSVLHEPWFRAEMAKNIRLYGQLHRFMPEIASTVGARVLEVPVNDRQRRFGTSKYGALSRTPRVILDLITVFFLLGFFSSPMRFFGAVAFTSGLLGVVIDGTLALIKIARGLTGGWEAFHAYAIGDRPLFFLGFLLILLSVQFLMMSLLGEMIMRTYYEVQNKPTYFVRNVVD